MIETEAAALVDILDPGGRLTEHEDRFVDHRQQDAVDDEARLVLAQHHLLAQPFRKGHGLVGCRLRRGKAGDDLDQSHDRDRVEEVQTDKTRRIGRVVGHTGNRDRAGIGGHDRVGGEEFASLLEDRLLDLFLFGRRLDDQAGILHRRIIGNWRDALQCRFGIGNLDLALAHQLAERLVDARMRLLGDIEAYIGQQHIHAVSGHGLRNAGTHLPRTDNGDRLVHRDFPSHVQQSARSNGRAATIPAPFRQT